MTVAILGPGLIGGSLALALHERQPSDAIRIYARKESAFPEIRKKLPKVHLTTNAADAVREADIVLLCVPIETMTDLVGRIRDHLKPSALVTDVGSVKGRVVKEIEPLLEGKALWVGSHPMAGSEQAGFSAARTDLFEGAAVIVTPTNKTAPETTQRADDFWRGLGARVIRLSPQDHDRHVGQISHLPHLVASALAGGTTKEALELAGGGFRDTTRVAAAPPELWAEILTSNAEAVGKHLDALIEDLREMRRVLDDPAQKQALLARLKAGHDIRSQLPEKRRP